MSETTKNTKLRIFMAVVIAHWAEHLFQVYQIYALGWAPHMAGGMLGYVFPWLVRSEVLHFSYAAVMMVGLLWLRGEFSVPGASRWWTAATVIQAWHLVEHTLLQAQALTHPFFGRDVPTSILQLWFPRVELHLFYNSVVTVPMVVALWLESRKDARSVPACECQTTSS
jgi:hypothetical protein